MAVSTIKRSISMVQLTNGSIDTSAFKALVLHMQDNAVSAKRVSVILMPLADANLSVSYVDSNASTVFNITGKAEISNGTLSLSDFKRATSGSSGFTSVTAPTILGIYGIA